MASYKVTATWGSICCSIKNTYVRTPKNNMTLKEKEKYIKRDRSDHMHIGSVAITFKYSFLSDV